MPETIPFPNGGDEETPRRSKMDRLIEELYEVLEPPGAHSLEEIQEKLSALNPDRHVSIVDIRQALAFVRKYSSRLGWSVPHVKRGRDRAERCYFRVLAKGSFDFDAEHRTFVRVGFLGTLNQIASMGKTEVAALRLALRCIRGKPQRFMLGQILDDVEYTTKRVNRILKAVNGQEF